MKMRNKMFFEHMTRLVLFSQLFYLLAQTYGTCRYENAQGEPLSRYTSLVVFELENQMFCELGVKVNWLLSIFDQSDYCAVVLNGASQACLFT